jgi:hypothetical protein
MRFHRGFSGARKKQRGASGKQLYGELTRACRAAMARKL